MLRQYRVTPLGEIVAVPERGTMMGNRGRLNDHEGRIRRTWQVRRWLARLLNFNDRHLQAMAPDRYTALFFLGEATALAAGHRPCFECRRRSFEAFAHAWAVGNGIDATDGGPASAMNDNRLHEERVGPGRSKRNFVANIDDLSDGVFVTFGEGVDRSCLLWDGHLLSWSPGGFKGLRRSVGGSAPILGPACGAL